jgi:hydrogenase nickel incorporation protein HypB
MCDTCGCGQGDVIPVEIRENLLAENDRAAAHNREHFHRHGVLAVNLMGSPGSGKTALLEATARAGGQRALAAVSGDLATDRDAERLRQAGIRSRSITTGSACHLDARLVHRALHGLELNGVDHFFIENVGNLVCPAIFDLGQTVSVVALAVTEGEDKPLKYPVMFQHVDLVVLTKLDLLPHLPGVSVDAYEHSLRQVAPAVPLVGVSAVAGTGMREWLGWLDARRVDIEAPAASADPR